MNLYDFMHPACQSCLPLYKYNFLVVAHSFPSALLFEWLFLYPTILMFMLNLQITFTENLENNKNIFQASKFWLYMFKSICNVLYVINLVCDVSHLSSLSCLAFLYNR